MIKNFNQTFSYQFNLMSKQLAHLADQCIELDRELKKLREFKAFIELRDVFYEEIKRKKYTIEKEKYMKEMSESNPIGFIKSGYKLSNTDDSS